MVAKRLDGATLALPLLSCLMPSGGNTGKLVGAKTPECAVYRLFAGRTHADGGDFLVLWSSIEVGRYG